MAANALTRVPFRGGEILVIETADGEFVAVKPICERLGVSWQGQHKKLTANSDRWGVIKMLIPSASGDQETLCLPRGKLFGWLATISPNKVAPALKEALTAYQNEADAALDRYFRQRQRAPEPPPPARPEMVEIAATELIGLMRAKIALLEERPAAPRRNARRITSGEIAAWRRMAADGASCRAIARHFSRSDNTVRAHLDRAREG